MEMEMDMALGLSPRKREILRKVSVLILIGLGLMCIVFFSPNAKPGDGAFFQAAFQTSWGHFLNLPAVWSSIKIILFSVGLFLIIESTGTTLAVLKYPSLAVPVYFLQIIPCLGLLCGIYCLIKSLL